MSHCTSSGCNYPEGECLGICLLTEASPDGNVEAVRQKLLDRSKVGLAKYGVTTERDDLDLVAWLRHLQEELLDAAVYVAAAIKRIEGDKNG